MDPRLKVLVVLLTGTLIGAVVAGGAISYVNGQRAPVPLNSAMFEPKIPGDRDAGLPSNSEVPVRSQSSMAPIASSEVNATNGPEASLVEIERGPKPSKPKVRARVAPVVEEEPAETRKLPEEGAKPDDGGSSRDDTPPSDGGSLR